ncbi:MAG: restriction endonuclease subunit S, partial [Ottowia sp.]|nr:restriction endonuclease subunit S [Ottowia sp.]
LEEQRRIAAILDQAETLRTQRRTALALLDSLTQSLFLDMFGDPVNNPMNWETLKVEQLAEQVTDGEHLTPKRESQGIKLLSARNVRDGYIDFHNVDFVGQVEHERIKKRCNPVRGDVLISCSGSIGRVASVETDEPFSLVRSVAMIRPKTNFVFTKFLEYYLRTPAMNEYMIRRANASSQANLFQGPIREMPVTVPPLPLQQTFATRIASIEALKATHRRALAALDALFASLQQRAFRGELVPTAHSQRAIGQGTVQSAEALQQLEADIGLEALIYVVRRMPAGDHYKSLKAVYFGDMCHLRHHERLIYNESYCALPHGPVPQAAYDATRVLNGERLLSDFDDEALRCALRRQGNTLTALRDADFSKLTPAMVESLDWAVRYCRDMTFEQTKTASHDSAYERTRRNEMISLQTLIDMVRAWAPGQLATSQASS